jgi:hypothetical protein
MALNWNAFLTDEGLTLPNDQWSDIPQTTIDSLSEMPKSSGRKAGSEAEDLTGFDPLFNGTAFDDSLFNPNDYFLSDLEVLQPFGDTLAGNDTTSESSPEPTSGVASTGPYTNGETPSTAAQTPASTSTGPNRSPPMPSVQRMTVQRAQTFPNPAYESMFPNNIESGFVEDLTFPNGPAGAVHSSKSSVDNNAKPAPPSTTNKRNRNKPDILSACWTSPLCPNHDQDGPPPNPSNCGGGCAPFLFANEDTLPTPTLNALLPEPQEVTAEDGIVEIQPRPKKRSESDASSGEPTGRQFPNKNTTEIPARVKDEVTSESPEQTQPSPEDAKPKSRRRLPHNQVERKYRESLNTQLESLRRVVPALQQNQRACDGADIEDLPTPSKPSKAVILASATAYIKQQEKDKKNLQDENQMLRTRLKALQALVKCEDCSLMQYVMDLKINKQQQ